MRKTTSWMSLLTASALAACGTSAGGMADGGTSGAGGSGGSGAAPMTELRGSIVNGSGNDAAGLGGSGAIAASKTVSARTIAADGTTENLATVSVGDGGSYSLDVPLHAGPTLLQAFDARGVIVASALEEDTLVAGAKLTVQPMTTESSVEAAVLLRLIATGTPITDVDLVGLRARIDAATAAVVHAHAVDDAGKASDDVSALSVATRAAQLTQEAYLASVKVSFGAYEADELSASDALTAALVADPSPTGTTGATADFVSKLATIDSNFSLDAAASAAEATRVTASARAAIVASSTSSDLVNAFLRVEGIVEGVAAAGAMTEAFTKVGASVSVMASLGSANTRLTTAIGASQTLANVTGAFDGWRAAVWGAPMGTGGALGTVLGSSVTTTASYEAALTTVTSLDAALETSLGASGTASGGDPSKLSGLVTEAYSTFDAGVASAVDSSATLSVTADEALMTSVFLGAEASF